MSETKKIDESNKYSDVNPVFHLKPQSNSRVSCELSGYIKNDERINDEQLDISEYYKVSDDIKEKIGNNTVLYGKVGEYTIVGKFCMCNICGEYLIKNNSFPVYYLSIIFTRPLLVGTLFNIYLNFQMDDEEKSRFKDPTKYYKSLINGKFSVKFVSVDDDYVSKIKKFVENSFLKKYVNDFNETNEEEIINKVKKEVEEEMCLIENLMKEKEFDKYPSKKNVFKTLNEICDDLLMSRLLKYTLELRDEERRKEKGSDKTYSVPTKILNIRDVANELK